MLNSGIEMGALNSTFLVGAIQLATFTLSYSIPHSIALSIEAIEYNNESITTPSSIEDISENSPLRYARLIVHRFDHLTNFFFSVKALHHVLDNYPFSNSCSYLRPSRERATTAVSQLRVRLLLGGFQIPSGY
jgi:hypothetical protein